MNKMLAYGASLESDLDLSPWLQKGEAGRYFLRLERRSKEAAMPALEICMPLLTSHLRNLSLHSDHEIAPGTAGQSWCLEASDVVRFYWISGECSIEYEALDHCTEQLLAFWAIHILLPLYLNLEGIYEFIHACAVEVAGDSILFTARSHGGKSTLADFFLKQGHRLISDDKVATYLEKGTYCAVPSHPNHRPYRKFEDLGYRVDDFSHDARPVDAFYALWGVEPDAEVAIGKISGHEKFAQLMPSYMFNFGSMQAARMSYLADMVSAVSIYRVEVPWDLDRLGEVHDAICAHRQSL